MNLFKSPWKISGIAGILFVVLSFIATGINNVPPSYNQNKLDIVMWYIENGTWYRYGHFIAGLAFLLFYFPFFAGFCERLLEAEGKPALWTKVTWAGAIMSPAVGTIAGSYLTGAALLDGNASADVSIFSISSNFYAYVVAGAFGGITMTSAALIILKTGIFSRWLGWTGLITGVTAIVSTGTFLENNPDGIFAAINGFSWIIYFLWIVAISIELLRVPYKL